jgi:glutamate synthase (ferredoxin)
LIGPEDVDLVDGLRSAEGIRATYGYEPGWGELGPALKQEVVTIMAGLLPEPEQPPTR